MPITVTPYDGERQPVLYEKGTGWDVIDGRLLITDAEDEGVATWAQHTWLHAEETADALKADKTPDKGNPVRVPDGPIVHAVMYRDSQMGTLCNSGAWGTPDLYTPFTDHVTCPACRDKLDPGRS